uniref:ANK_REP_REGION domain-containing protein n=1 Tax=Angiostrongylus cantonensis TaxID=6313 RepID=A0A0K0CYU1_ANGCA
LPLISRQLSSEDLTIQSDALRACRFMSEYPDFFQVIFYFTSFYSFHLEDFSYFYVFRIFFFQKHSADMVNSGLLFNLLPLMSRNTTMREACFVMSNIAAEGNDMLQAVLDVGTLKEIAILLEAADYETRKEAFYVMYHAATSSRSCHLAAILGADLLSPLCDFLTVLEHALVADVMDALSALLAYGEQLAIDFLNPVATRMEELGAKEKLEFLCESHSMRLHVAAHEILENIDSTDIKSITRLTDRRNERLSWCGGERVSLRKE